MRFSFPPQPLVFVLAVGSVSIFAQSVRGQPPLYQGTSSVVPGVFVTPISGVPFSATVIIEDKQILSDGTTETRFSQAMIARDSSGRIRNERHAMMPEGFHGAPPLLSVHIFDPATRVSYMINPFTRIARERIIPPPVNYQSARNSQSADLGITTLNGMQAHGTRISRNIPAGVSGTGRAVTVTDEFWYSDELHMNLLETHTDVRGGTQNVSILSIKRDEPSQALFEVPAGYKVVDMNPPADAPAAQLEPK